MSPKKISINKQDCLVVQWDDGTDSIIKLSNLRQNCPCATCKVEKEKQSNSYLPIFTKEQLKITNISIVGNYALGIEWKDGHSTGIYEYQYLKSLS